MALFSTISNKSQPDGGGLLESLIGIAGVASETIIKSREADVRIAEAKKAAAQTQASAVSQATQAIQSQKVIEIIRWVGIGTVTLVVGSALLRFVKRQVRGS